MNNDQELMLHDYLVELLVLLQDAQKIAPHKDTFADGRRMGLYEALCLCLDTAEQFGISTKTLGVANIEPDRFLE